MIGPARTASPTQTPLCQWTRSCRERAPSPHNPGVRPLLRGRTLLNAVFMEPRRVLVTGARGRIGSVLRPALRDEFEELRLSDLEPPDDLHGSETAVAADLTDLAAVERAVAGVDAVVHLGAVPDEAPFEEIAGPNLHGAYHVFEACRRARRAARGLRQLEPRDRHVPGRRAARRRATRRARTGSTARRRCSARRSGGCTSTASGCRSCACGSAPSSRARASGASCPRGSATPTPSGSCARR